LEIKGDGLMKKIIFGAALLVSGALGVAFSMLSVAVCTEALGTINDSSDILAYLGWYKMTPIFICFVLMALFGIAICVKEAYFGKK
jgi:L-lactate permease